jgi:hypothetical protein
MVIFTGGSWAVGEWKYHQLSGPGVAYYFGIRSGQPVLNLSSSSIGNIEQIQRIQSLLTRYTPDESDQFYWLVHNPLVDMPIEKFYQGQTSLTDSVTNALHTQLAFANTVATNHKITLGLIGASCDLDSVSVEQYTHLRTVVPSWGKLLNPEFPSSIFSHQTDILPELHIALKQHRPDLLGEFDLIRGMAFGKRRAMVSSTDMYHSFHPTSLAHEHLSNHLAHIYIQ